MVRYILTDTIDYPVAGENWMLKFKEFYNGRIIEGFLDSPAFLRKLHDTFNMDENTLGELPEDARSYLFGSRKAEELFPGKGADPVDFDDRAWLIREDERTAVFYRYEKQRYAVQISQSPYQFFPEKTVKVFIVKNKKQDYFDSNNQLMRVFLTWYRGMSETTALNAFYDQVYYLNTHYMIENLKWVFGEKKYVELLKDVPDHRKYMLS